MKKLYVLVVTSIMLLSLCTSAFAMHPFEGIEDETPGILTILLAVCSVLLVIMHLFFRKPWVRISAMVGFILFCIPSIFLSIISCMFYEQFNRQQSLALHLLLSVQVAAIIAFIWIIIRKGRDDMKIWQRYALWFFAVHSALVIANLICVAFLSGPDGSWIIGAIFVNTVDLPVYYLVVLSERLFPHSQFGNLSDYLLHPICLIFGGLFYALLGSVVGLVIGKRKGLKSTP